MTTLTHYLDLKAIPQAELIQSQVISQLMQSLHGLLPAYNGQIGISFPAYGQQNTLGGIIRLLGSSNDIAKIKSQIENNNTFKDYALITEIRTIPDTINEYRRFSRIRTKGNSAITRSEKRLTAQDIWTEEIRQNMIEKWGAQRLKQPHIHLKSGSTTQPFILWIEQHYFKKPTQGKFNAYGLSQQTTVPFF